MTKSSVYRLFVMLSIVVCFAHFSLLVKSDTGTLPKFYLDAKNRAGKLIFNSTDENKFILSMGVDNKAYNTEKPKKLFISFGNFNTAFESVDGQGKRVLSWQNTLLDGSVFVLNFKREQNSQSEFTLNVNHGSNTVGGNCTGCKGLYTVQGDMSNPEYVLEVKLVGDPDDNNSIAPGVILYSASDYMSIDMPATAEAENATETPAGPVTTPKPTVGALTVGLITGGSVLAGGSLLLSGIFGVLSFLFILRSSANDNNQSKMDGKSKKKKHRSKKEKTQDVGTEKTEGGNDTQSAYKSAIGPTTPSLI